MIKILFVCHGNICRSPMAEFILKKLVKDKKLENDFEISSCATSLEEIGNDIYPPAKKCLTKHNIPYNIHYARQITRDDFNYYDYIIAMENYNINNLQRICDEKDKVSLLLDYTCEPGDISDPWYTGDFETTYDEILKGCNGLLDYFHNNRCN